MVWMLFYPLRLKVFLQRILTLFAELPAGWIQPIEKDDVGLVIHLHKDVVQGFLHLNLAQCDLYNNDN